MKTRRGKINKNNIKLSHLKNGDRSPEDVVEVFSIAFTSFVVGDDHGAGALACYSFCICILAKLTTEQVHTQYAAKIQNLLILFVIVSGIFMCFNC